MYFLSQQLDKGEEYISEKFDVKLATVSNKRGRRGWPLKDKDPPTYSRIIESD